MCGLGPGVVDLRFWGKERGLGGARYPLVCHGVDAAAAVRVLWWDFVSVGIRARLASALGVSEAEACSVLELWASLHDIGKLSVTFQQQVAVPDGYSVPVAGEPLSHETASSVFLQAGLESLGYSASGPKSLARLVGDLLGGHHGTFPPPVHWHQAQFPNLGLGDAAWNDQRLAMLGVLGAVLSPPVPSGLSKSAAALMAGVVILADWLVSQTGFILRRLGDVPEIGDVASLGRFVAGSVGEARVSVARAGLGRVRWKPGSFGEEFPDFPANALQDSIATRLPEVVTGPGLLVIAAPMGWGKTEATLHAARLMGEASGTSGMFFALPTMATSDQMFGRVAKYVARRGQGSTSQALLHGMAWLRPVDQLLADAEAAEGVSSDSENRVWASEWLHGAKRALLAGVGVGTIDQALLSVLRVRHNALRLFALAGKTVVIDEVHAFSWYMRELLKILLRWLGEWGVPVVLMSATLPAHVVRDLSDAYLGKTAGSDDLGSVVPYPGWIYIERGRPAVTTPVSFPAERRRNVDVELKAVEKNEDSSVDRMPALRDVLTPVATEGGCAVVICTTVAHAQRTYQDVCRWGAEHGVRVRLLHSRFPAHQRERITKELTHDFGKPELAEDGDVDPDQRAQRTVVVATQVVEQSLDVDFDLVVTDLAPIELVLQRAGRLQRHPDWDGYRPVWAVPNRGGHRRLVVLTGPNGDPKRLPCVWKYIYPEANLMRCQKLLEQHREEGIAIPEDVQTLVDAGHPDVFPEEDGAAVEGFLEAEFKRSGEAIVEKGQASVSGIPLPHQVRNLGDLSWHVLDEERATTRFNADSVRVLPYFICPDGNQRLGSPTGSPLPEPDGDRLSREQAATVMSHTMPVPGSLVRGRDDRHRLPEPWCDLRPLTDLVGLPHVVDEAGTVHPVRVGDRTLLLDDELGLWETSASGGD